MIVVIILIYLILILFIGIMMGSKGRDLGKDRRIGPVKGFWLGFLLGRIGLFIVKRSPIIEPLHATTSNAPSVTIEEQDGYKANTFAKNQYEKAQEPQQDGSILTGSRLENDTYLDQLAIEVCLHGEQLEKYERMVTKQYSSEVYANLHLFVDEVNRCRQRQIFTNTSIANLRYLGPIVGLSQNTVNDIVNQLKYSLKPSCLDDRSWMHGTSAHQ